MSDFQTFSLGELKSFEAPRKKIGRRMIRQWASQLAAFRNSFF
ncbi:MAG TPA: hypothetical protein VNE39_08350 [Planctomycetota bacterium]|nr:hypothetical protein [Planctomycetota bacterium]